MTLEQLRAKSPFPWRTEVNFDQFGSVRMVDAAGKEVPLFHITAFATYASKKIEEEQPSCAPGATETSSAA